jgi:predicted metalloprotease
VAAGRLARLALLAACLTLLLGRAPGEAAAKADASAAGAPTVNAVLLADLEAYADEVAADLDAYWAEQLAEAGVAYRRPEAVFFTETVSTPCGLELVPGVTAPGFYCSREERIYVDGVDNVAVAEAFGHAWLSTLLGHEWGHHVQNLLGTFPDGLIHPEAVVERLELQADCLAGGWTADADGRGLIDPDAVDVALYLMAYASNPLLREIGMNDGHGTTEQRLRAFLQGYDDGTAACLA